VAPDPCKRTDLACSNRIGILDKGTQSWRLPPLTPVFGTNNPQTPGLQGLFSVNASDVSKLCCR
jgi:hypothetical protein